MIRSLGICCAILTLSSCSYFGNMNSNESKSQLAMCNELKYQIIYNQATADPLVSAQQEAQMDTLNREYRENGCK